MNVVQVIINRKQCPMVVNRTSLGRAVAKCCKKKDVLGILLSEFHC